MLLSPWSALSPNGSVYENNEIRIKGEEQKSFSPFTIHIAPLLESALFDKKEDSTTFIFYLLFGII